jgi:hypothetical protein
METMPRLTPAIRALKRAFQNTGVGIQLFTLGDADVFVSSSPDIGAHVILIVLAS